MAYDAATAPYTRCAVTAGRRRAVTIGLQLRQPLHATPMLGDRCPLGDRLPDTLEHRSAGRIACGNAVS